MLPDVNILIYAYDESSKQHAQAKEWWKNQLNGTQMVGLSWVVLLGFIRIMTHPRIYENPYSPPEILKIIGSWLDQPHVKIILPSDQHFARLSELLIRVGTAGNLMTDAHLAALAMERGLILQTTDADFARFPNVKWKNPLG